MDAIRKTYPYKLCKTRDRKGDLSKRWYVEFYIYDIAKERLVRKVDYSINRYTTAKERHNAARYISRIIDKKLEEGGHINSGLAFQQVKPRKVYSLKQAVDFAIQIKLTDASDRTKHDYASYKRVFIEWAIKNNYHNIRVEDVPGRLIHEFFDHLKVERKVGNRTHNNYLIFIKLIFNFLVNREILKKSPVNVPKLKETAKTHVPYSDTDAETVKKFLKENDPKLYLFCSFIYYTFIRPTELRQLQVKYLYKDKILVPAAINHNGKEMKVSKNGKSEFVVIPEGLQELIEEYKLRDQNKNWFIFGTKTDMSGPEPISRNRLTEKYRKYLKDLELYDDGYTLYSWKHTGVIKLYLAIKDLKKVQRQCRHTDITVTDQYLRDLGLFDNDEVVNNFPTF